MAGGGYNSKTAANYYRNTGQTATHGGSTRNGDGTRTTTLTHYDSDGNVDRVTEMNSGTGKQTTTYNSSSDTANYAERPERDRRSDQRIRRRRRRQAERRRRAEAVAREKREFVANVTNAERLFNSSQIIHDGIVALRRDCCTN